VSFLRILSLLGIITVSLRFYAYSITNKLVYVLYWFRNIFYYFKRYYCRKTCM